MPFVKGQSGNPSGGKKGVPRKVTQDVREAFARLLEGKAPELDSWLTTVAQDDPAKALDLVIRIAEYHIPKLARTETQVSGGLSVNIQGSDVGLL